VKREKDLALLRVKKCHILMLFAKNLLFANIEKVNQETIPVYKFMALHLQVILKSITTEQTTFAMIQTGQVPKNKRRWQYYAEKSFPALKRIHVT